MIDEGCAEGEKRKTFLLLSLAFVFTAAAAILRSRLGSDSLAHPLILSPPTEKLGL